MIRAWTKWKANCSLPFRKFIKFYMYDRLIVRPVRAFNHLRRKLNGIRKY